MSLTPEQKEHIKSQVAQFKNLGVCPISLSFTFSPVRVEYENPNEKSISAHQSTTIEIYDKYCLVDHIAPELAEQTKDLAFPISNTSYHFTKKCPGNNLTVVAVYEERLPELIQQVKDIFTRPEPACLTDREKELIIEVFSDQDLLNSYIDGHSIVYSAIYNKKPELAEVLLSIPLVNPALKLDISPSSLITLDKWISPLYLASAYGYTDVCAGLIRLKTAYSSEDKLKNYIHEKVDIDQSNPNNGYSPLGIAVKNGYLSLARLLLGHGANPNDYQESKGASGVTPLWMAVFSDHLAMVDLLLKFNANANLPNKKGVKSGETPLGLAVSKTKINIEIIRALKKAQALDMQECVISKNVTTPLTYARRNFQDSHPEIINALEDDKLSLSLAMT